MPSIPLSQNRESFSQKKKKISKHAQHIHLVYPSTIQLPACRYKQHPLFEEKTKGEGKSAATLRERVPKTAGEKTLGLIDDECDEGAARTDRSDS